jgi:2-keto-3-deoxy-L-rhamnonate aldolase RhmA
VSHACHRHGKAMGMDGINDDGNARRYIGMGARFITSGNDHGFIFAGSIERANFYRELAVEAAGRRTGGSAKTR